MAVLTALTAFDVRAIASDAYPTTLELVDPSELLFRDFGNEFAVFGEDLSVDGLGAFSGAITGLARRRDGVDVFELADASLDAFTFLGLFAVGDATGAAAMALSGDDLLTGSAESDGLDGFGGDDVLRGGDGDDFLYASAGRDDMDGGEGFDVAFLYEDFSLDAGRGVTADLRRGFFIDQEGFRNPLRNVEELVGSAVDDLLVGGPGDDFFSPSSGDDTIRGGAGEDAVFFWEGPVGARGDGVRVHLGRGVARDPQGGRDHLKSVETIIATEFDDTIVGSRRDETFHDAGGSDRFVGRGGIDWVCYDRGMFFGDGSIEVDLKSGRALDSLGGVDRLLGIEGIRGGEGDDRLFGDGGRNEFNGQLGADLINGRGGADVFYYAEQDYSNRVRGVDVVRRFQDDEDLFRVGLGLADVDDLVIVVRENRAVVTYEDFRLIVRGDHAALDASDFELL